MKDFVANDWTFRQTGIMVDVPEISGQIFVGRQKEGFSLNKIMVGYGGWTMERTEISDAAIPILADGVKWIGYSRRNISSGTSGSLGTFSLRLRAFQLTHISCGPIRLVACGIGGNRPSLSASTSVTESRPRACCSSGRGPRRSRRRSSSTRDCFQPGAPQRPTSRSTTGRAVAGRFGILRSVGGCSGGR